MQESPPTGRSGMIRLLLFLCFILGASLLFAWGDRGRAFVDHYISEVDGSRQEYGVYVPARKAPSPDGYPTVLHFHGYGWSVSSSFSEFQKQWADDHGWLLANVNGRGPTFYDGIGENDVFRVLDDIDFKYGVDRRRVYVTGGSMGGTGAYRMGVRHPDVFAAVVGVDGWADYRLWHMHWYARADDRGSVEQFRKRLLEAVSPLMMAESASTVNIGLITDMNDTIVWPANAIQLQQKLQFLGAIYPGEYSHSGEARPGGHGAGYDLEKIYAYFLGKATLVRPRRLRHVCTQLKYGAQHWISIERMLVQGARAMVDADAQDGLVVVKTSNVAALRLRLPVSPVAEAPRVRVIVDGYPVYMGPPDTLNLFVVLDAGGNVTGWTMQDPFPSLRKTPALEGPIGDAFTKPFVLVYGTTGNAEQTAQNRREAQQFADDWNGMFVHYDAVEPIPDMEVTARDVELKSLILFGASGTNWWIDRIFDAAQIPVEVRPARIVVHDPECGDRAYIGDKFGCFVVYPNPLSDYRTYFVISHGSYAIKPDGTQLRGLGFDLEKLPWAWPDYVIFNSDQSELPYVENVNNKPNSVCYEAAYFVEAGFFDQDWRFDRADELRRMRVVTGEKSRTIHIADVDLQARSRNGATFARATVKVTDAASEPVEAARVTGRWGGHAVGTQSAVTDESGVAVLDSMPTRLASGSISFEVLNVMAADAAYDWQADVERSGTVVFTKGAEPAAAPTNLHLSIADVSGELRSGALVQVNVRLDNTGPARQTVGVRLGADAGTVFPQQQEVVVQPGRSRLVSFWWNTAGAAVGPHLLRAQLLRTAGGAETANQTATRTVNLLPDD